MQIKIVSIVEFLFVLILLSSSISLKCQDQHSKLNANISVGPSIPVGGFSKNSPGFESTDGWAKLGYSVEGVLSYEFNKSPFGAQLLIGFEQNGRDDNTLKESLSNNTGGNNVTITADAGTWSIWKVLAGPNVRVPIAKNSKTFFRASINAGILFTSIPSYSYKIYSAGQSNPYEWGTSGSTHLPASFCYQLSAGMEFKLDKKIYLSGTASYFNSSPAWKYTIQFPPNEAGTKVSKTYQISALNVLFGITFIL